MGMRKDICLYEDALAIAKKKNENYNRVQEYKDAYYFYENVEEERVGGDTGVIVLKDGGTTLIPYNYFLNPASKAEEIGVEKEC